MRLIQALFLDHATTAYPTIEMYRIGRDPQKHRTYRASMVAHDDRFLVEVRYHFDWYHNRKNYPFNTGQWMITLLPAYEQRCSSWMEVMLELFTHGYQVMSGWQPGLRDFPF